MQDNCPICSKKAEVVRPPGGVDAYDIVCPRCGNFRISRTLASTNLEKYGERNIISGIIRNRYENGEKLELHTRLLSEITQTINIPDNPFELIDSDQRFAETLMMGMRLAEGVPVERLERESGRAIDELIDPKKRKALEQEELLVADAERLVPTLAGMQRLNGVLSYLL